jgi:hypothetical protein
VEDQVEQHIESINLKDIEIVHGHAPRGSESTEFNRSVVQLKKDGFCQCFASGRTDGLQVHHFLAEWSEADLVDFDKLKLLAEKFDIYGYAAKMKDIPMTSVDDIRNLLVLNQEFHTGTNSTAGNPTGIHNLVFPFWISQINCKKGMDPVPQEGETLEKAEQRIGG